MSTPLRAFNFLTAVLFLFLMFPVSLLGIPLGVSEAIAGISTTSSEEGRKELEKKLEELQQILIERQENNDHAGEADTLNQMGAIYVKLKEYAKALELHQQALVIYQESINKQKEAETLGYIGDTYFKLGEYEKVKELFRQALESARKIGDQELEKNIFNIMRKYGLPRYQAGGWFIDPALLEPPNPPSLYHNGVDIDPIQLEPPNPSMQEMLRILQLNLFINQELKNNNEVVVESNEVIVESISLEKCELWYNHCEEQTLHSIGFIYYNLGQYTKTLEFYDKALISARERKNYFREAFIMIDIGVVYTDLGKYDLALEHFQKTLEFIRKYKHEVYTLIEIETLSKLGLIYKIQGENELALSFLQQALLILKCDGSCFWSGADILNNMGAVYFQMNKYSEALEFYQKALENKNYWNPGLKGFILNNIGLVYTEMEDYPKALEYYQKALALFREQNHRPGERFTLANLGALLEKQNQPELAIVFYKESVNVTEEIRREIQEFSIQEQKTYTETVAETYRRLADLLLSQGRILEAQQVLELLKVQELRNYTRNNRTGGETSDIATNPTETEILKIHGTLIALGQTIEDCKKTDCNQLSQHLDKRETITTEFNQTVRTLEQEIRNRRGDDKAFLDPGKLALTSEKIVSTQPGTVLIYPIVLEDKIWILWASAGGITKSIEVPQVGQKKLGETVLKFRELIQDPRSDIKEIKAVGKQLYDWIMPSSLQKELKENQIQNLVFSLDHVTRYIPMGALSDGEKYLIENYTISTIISADLTDTSDRLPSGTDNTSVLALGVSASLAGFRPLPNVPEELDTIVRQDATDEQGIYPGLELLNQNFHRKSLRDNLGREKYSILHIATHGEFVPGSSYDSYLLLGDGNKLPIPDIENLGNLGKIHLVVLSACETALGDTGQDGTEIAGLSYYFLQKGAKAVMATLWKVDDKSTQELMQQFYGNLSQSTTQAPITKAQALRQAQLSLLLNNQTATDDENRSIRVESRQGVQTSTSDLKFSHPYYWAAFILIGNPW